MPTLPASPLPTSQTGKTVAVVGGGPAGLFAAECLAKQGHSVTVYDHMARPGRKLLMAGRSGLNLTHEETDEAFLAHYGTSRPRIEPAFHNFPPNALRQWAEGLGQECFTGTSHRVFLKTLKASPLLRAWLERLRDLGVRFQGNHRLQELVPAEAASGTVLTFETPTGSQTIKTDAVILAMGGASWSRLGSDGKWAALFPQDCAPFLPTNCGFLPDWPEEFLQRHEGETLRGIALTFAGHTHRGDLIVTKRGLEGAPLYALSAPLRDALLPTGVQTSQPVTASLDLRPQLSVEQIHKRLAAQRPRESRANKLRKALKLGRLERELLREEAPDVQTPADLASTLKALPLRLKAPDALDHAISTAGGLKWEALERSFMLKALPGVFACGEMLDWEAPTGGYLLQGCFSTAHASAAGAGHWLLQQTEDKRVP